MVEKEGKNMEKGGKRVRKKEGYRRKKVERLKKGGKEGR